MSDNVASHLPGAVAAAPARKTSEFRVRVFDEFATAFRQAGPIIDDRRSMDLFQTWGWFENLDRHGLDSTRRRVVAVVDLPGESRAFALPLMVSGASDGAVLGTQTQALANYYTSLYGPIGDEALCTTEALRALLRALRREGVPMGVFDLHPLDLDAPFARAARAALEAEGFVVDSYFCFGNWHRPCRGVSFAAFAETLPSRQRNTIKRARKKLDAAGRCKIAVHTSPGPVLEEAIHDFVRIYKSSWKEPEPFPEFVPGLCRMMAASGWLRLGVLRLDDKPAAAQLWLVRDGQALIYKLAYDEVFGHLSPGSVLSAEMFRRALDDDQVYDIDYLTGDDAYKRDWMSHRRERQGLIAYRLTSPSGMFGALRHFGAKWVRRHRQKASTAEHAANS